MKHLIIGSGAMMAYKFIGVLKYLKDNGKLDDLKEISSASSGSIIAAFYILFNGDVDKLLKIMIDIDIRDSTKKNVKNFLKKFGLIDSANIKKIADANGLANVTFRELYEQVPIKLYISTFDLLSNKTVYLSIDTVPDMDVSTAIMYSTAVPILFTPGEKQFLDGSTAEWTPGAPFIGKNDIFEIRSEELFDVNKPPKSIIEYLLIVIKNIMSNRIKYQEFDRIELPIDFDIFDFTLPTEKKLELYTSGYEYATIKIK